MKISNNLISQFFSSNKVNLIPDRRLIITSYLVDQERFELSTSPSVAVRSIQLKLLVHVKYKF